MNPFAIVDLLDKTTDLLMGIMLISILGQLNRVLLDGPNHALGIAVWSRFTNFCHTNLNGSTLKYLNIASARILQTLSRVRNIRLPLRQRLFAGCLKSIAQVNVPDDNRGVSDNVNEHCQLNALLLHVGVVRDPKLVWAIERESFTN